MFDYPKARLVALLRATERYIHLDMVYLASGSFWQSFGQVGSSLVALGLVFLFANYLPKETYGTYRYLISLAGLLTVFTLTGMSQAVSQAVATGREGALRTSVRYQLKWNALFMLAFLVLGIYYLSHENFAYTSALFVLGICVPLTNAFNTYGAYLAGKRQFRLNNVFSVLSTLVYALGMVVAIFWSGEVIWLVVAYALSTLATNAFFYFLTLRLFRPPEEPAEDVLAYGRHLTYINLMTPVVSQLDSIILNHFWGAAPLAVYSIATAIPNRAVPFVKNLVDLGSPKVATKTSGEIAATFWGRIGLGFVFGTLAATAYALAAPYLFTYLLPQYLDAVFYTQLLALTFVVAIPIRYLGIVFAAKRLTKTIFLTNVINSSVRLALYVFLGIWGGIVGLVMAQVLSSFIGFAVNLFAWLRVQKQLGG